MIKGKVKSLLSRWVNLFPKTIEAIKRSQNDYWQLAYALRDEVDEARASQALGESVTLKEVMQRCVEVIEATTGATYEVATLSQYRTVAINFPKAERDRITAILPVPSFGAFCIARTPEHLEMCVRAAKKAGHKMAAANFIGRTVQAIRAKEERKYQAALERQRKANEAAQQRKREAEERKRRAKTDAERKKAEAEAAKAKEDVEATKTPPKRDETVKLEASEVTMIEVEAEMARAVKDSIKAAAYIAKVLNDNPDAVDDLTRTALMRDAKKVIDAWQDVIDLCGGRSRNKIAAHAA